MDTAHRIHSACCQFDPFWREFSIQNLVYRGFGRVDERIIVSASHLPTNTDWVLKITRKKHGKTSEAHTVQNLNHPNIVQFLRVSRLGNWNVICMRRAECDLVGFMEQNGIIPENLARKFFVQLLQSLKYLHSAGYTHRDVKLENILVYSNDHITLIDFEHCALIDPQVPFRQEVGTKIYSSPEMRRGRYFGPEVDMWAAGVTLYCMLNGKFPFSLTLLDQFKENVLWIVRGFTPSLSLSAQDLLRKILDANSSRFTVSQSLEHLWCCNISPKSPRSLLIRRGSSPATFFEDQISSLSLSKTRVSSKKGGSYIGTRQTLRNRFTRS